MRFKIRDWHSKLRYKTKAYYENDKKIGYYSCPISFITTKNPSINYDKISSLYEWNESDSFMIDTTRLFYDVSKNIKPGDIIEFENCEVKDKLLYIKSELLEYTSDISKDGNNIIYKFKYIFNYILNDRKTRKTFYHKKYILTEKGKKEQKKKAETRKIYNDINKEMRRLGLDFWVSSEVSYNKLDKLFSSTKLKRIFRAPYREKKLKELLKQNKKLNI